MFTNGCLQFWCPLRHPFPNQQSDGFPLEFLLQGLKQNSEHRAKIANKLSQNCEQKRILSKQEFLIYRNGMRHFCLQFKASCSQRSFLLTVDNFSFFAYSWSFFVYSFRSFTYSFIFFAYSGKARLRRALRDCEQRSLTVSKKAPTVSNKASPNRKSASHINVPDPHLLP